MRLVIISGRSHQNSSPFVRRTRKEKNRREVKTLSLSLFLSFCSMRVVIFRAPCLYSFIERARVTVRSVVLFSVDRSEAVFGFSEKPSSAAYFTPHPVSTSPAQMLTPLSAERPEAARCSAPITSIRERRSSSRILYPLEEDGIE